jgi:hypothetical protein
MPDYFESVMKATYGIAESVYLSPEAVPPDRAPWSLAPPPP